MTLRVEVATSATAEMLAALHVLVPLLSSSAAPLSESELEDIVSSKATTLLLAYDNDAIVGTLSLAIFRTPSGLRAWIEDVIVDQAARGSGVGRALVSAAITYAENEHVRTIDLTSRPSRASAHRLYERMGFVVRETNNYRLDIEGLEKQT